MLPSNQDVFFTKGSREIVCDCEWSSFTTIPSSSFAKIFSFSFSLTWLHAASRAYICIYVGGTYSVFHKSIAPSKELCKVSFFHQCSKMLIIPIKKLNIQTCFFQFFWFFRLKCWFQGQIIPRIHLILPKCIIHTDVFW